MIATAHLLIGGTIGSLIEDPLLIFLYAFFSHYLLDALPHVEPGIWRKTKKDKDEGMERWEYYFIVLDLLIGLSLLIWLAWNKYNFKLILFGAFVAILPDILDHLSILSKYLKKQSWYSWLFYLHKGIHFSTSFRWRYLAILPFLLVVIYAIIWLR